MGRKNMTRSNVVNGLDILRNGEGEFGPPWFRGFVSDVVIFLRPIKSTFILISYY